jgi:gliding motility-associated lipoprotein GldD
VKLTTNSRRVKHKIPFCPIIFFLSVLFLVTCSSDYTPKPSGYLYINPGNHTYESLSLFPEFEFNVSSRAKITEINDTTQGRWFNLVYPSFNAQIYCSYLRFAKNNLKQIEADQQKLVSMYVSKADSFQEQAFENQEQKVFGLVYSMKGNVSSPIQFVLTDSVTSFFRGALYFENAPNQDSIAPVLEYINEDIRVIIESFRWKK